MARRGFGGTALRAALGAVGGITEAMQERETRKLEQERQSKIDEAATRQEQRQALAAGMVQADQYIPQGIAGGMDMPGATPRSPVFRQKIGGVDFVLPEAPSATKHRESIFKTQAEMAKERQRINLKNTEDEGERTALKSYLVAKGIPEAKANVIANAPVGVRNAMLSRELPVPTRGGKEEPSEEEQRDIGLAYIAAQARNPALMRALQTEFTANPGRAEDPGLVAYRLKKNRVVPNLGAASGYKPPARPAAKEDDLSLPALLRQPANATPTSPSAPATPPQKSMAPPAPAPRQAPAARTQPPSMIDQAVEEERRLWDEAVKKHGQQRVLQEFGPRP